MKNTSLAALALGATALMLTAHAQSKITCDADNGGITLPQGFCALVVAEDVGVARHMAVAPNGDLYVATQTRGARGGTQTGGGVVAQRDSNGDGKFDQREQIGSGSTTGVGLRNGYLYLAQPKTIQRYKMTSGQLKPAGEPEMI